MTVLKCYKGDLDPGDEIRVAMVGDQETPDVTKVVAVGKAGFFFINRRPEEESGLAGVYECNPIDIAPYDEFGEPMARLLRSVPQHELRWLKTLLISPKDKDVGNPQKCLDLPAVGSPGINWPSVIPFSACDGFRGPLLARKSFWQHCLATGQIPSGGIEYGETHERLSFTDTSVYEYSQAVYEERMGDGAKPIPPAFRPVSPNARLFEWPVWLRWEPPEKSRLLYNLFHGLPKTAQSMPDGASWCVITDCVKNGKCIENRFYLPNRTEIQTLLNYVNVTGEDCSQWKHDKRLSTIPDWLTRDMKYDPAIWER